jgi:hypothetical protein
MPGNDNPGMRGKAVAGFVVLVLIATAPAAAAPARDALVRPGRGIGKISLGMTQEQVRAALGRHRSVSKRRTLGFGQQYLELQWGFAEWTVGFQGRRGALRVVRIGTTLNRQRTREGLGTGSRIRDLLRVYPQATCSTWAGLGAESSVGWWITVRHPNHARTVFVVFHEGVAQPPPGRVVEVMIQLPVSGVAERRASCGSNWRRW